MKKIPALLLLVVLLLVGCSVAGVSDTPSTQAESVEENEKIPDIVQSTPKETSEEAVAPKTRTKKRSPAPLDEQIEDLLDEYMVDPAAVTYVITDLSTKESFRLNDQEEFIGASLYKLPLAMLYYDEFQAGQIEPEDTIMYEDWMYEEGPLENEIEPGDLVTIENLLYSLIVYSDNISGHMLYSYYGGWEYMRESALAYTEEEAYPNYYSGDNYLTADYMNDVLGYLYQHPSRYANLLDLMAQAEPEDFLNASLYGHTYQKIGYLDDMSGGAGLVLNDRPYSIVVMTYLGDLGRPIMGEINRIAYEYFNQMNED